MPPERETRDEAPRIPRTPRPLGGGCGSPEMKRIRHCMGQLTDEQVWWRPAEGMNSVGNLLLHLAGNVRQWIIGGLGSVPDSRDRPAEFAERRHVPKAELWAQLEAAVKEAREV